METNEPDNRVPAGRKDLNDLVDRIIFKEQPKLRKLLEESPHYRPLLDKITSEIYERYRGPIYWGKVIDKWDRVTSAVGLLSEFCPATLGTISAAEDILEMAPKALYGAYYAYKTHDLKTLPYWFLNELASFTPFIGDLLDMRNIYVNQAQKRFALAVKKKFDETRNKLPKEA